MDHEIDHIPVIIPKDESLDNPGESINMNLDPHKDEKNGNDIIDDKNKPHNGRPITKIEISPNAKYIVTYSEENETIVGWNVENIQGRLELDDTVKPYPTEVEIVHVCVSDEKKLVLSMVEYGTEIYSFLNIHEYLSKCSLISMIYKL